MAHNRSARSARRVGSASAANASSSSRKPGSRGPSGVDRSVAIAPEDRTAASRPKSATRSGASRYRAMHVAARSHTVRPPTATLGSRMPSSSSSSSFSLVARDLAREHGSFTVLDGVDVSIGPRTRLGVVGPNGVGKTTLLRLLAGIDQPDRGTVTSTPPSVRVGYLPQEPERGDEPLLEFLRRRTGV